MRRSLAIIAIYVLVGPLIGLVVFAGGVAVLALANGQAQGARLGPFFLIYGILFAHFVGAAWAALAGCVAAGLVYLRGGWIGWIGLASGCVSFAVACALGAAQLPPGPGSPVGQVVDGYGPGFLVLMGTVHLLSAAGSGFLARKIAPR